MKISRGQVLALVAKWKPRLLLESWDIRIKLTKALAPGVQADCSCYPEYFDAVIRLHPERVTAEDVEGVLVHELCHLLTWEGWELAEDAARGNPDLTKRLTAAQEKLVSTLQRIVMR